MSPAPGSPLHSAGPKGLIGSTVNVVMCGGMAVGAATGALVQSQPFLFLIAGLFALMEFQFVPIMLRARRRRRETAADGSSTADHADV